MCAVIQGMYHLRLTFELSNIFLNLLLKIWAICQWQFITITHSLMTCLSFFSFFKEFYVHHEEIENCVTAGYNGHYINLHHFNVGHNEVAA